MADECTRLWTVASAPFRMGGTTNEVGAIIPVGTAPGEAKPCKLRNYDGFVVVNPVRQCAHVFEATSGAIIGTARTPKAALARVRGDIDTGERKEMETQLAQACRMLNGVLWEEPEHFFGRFHQHPKRAESPDG